MNAAEELIKNNGKQISTTKFKVLVSKLEPFTERGEFAKHSLDKQCEKLHKFDFVKLEMKATSQVMRGLKEMALGGSKWGEMTISELEGLYGVEIHSQSLSGTAQSSFFAEVTRRIIALIKEGNLPWQMPWNEKYRANDESEVLFANYITNKNYRGINRSMCMLFGGGDKYFLTEAQAAERGGKIKNKSSYVPITYFVRVFKDVEVERTNDSGEKEIVTTKFLLQGLKWYKVYPLSQIEGLKPIARKPVKQKTLDFTPIEICEKIVASYPAAPKLLHKGNSAFYTPHNDTVVMPPKASFNSVPEYYSTLFHELIHSTGHPNRLDRLKPAKFGSKTYAAEELVAELGSSFLCSVANIDYFTLKNSAAYLKSWSNKLIEELSQDNQLFVRTQFQALKAAKHMMGPFYKTWTRETDNSPKPKPSKPTKPATKKEAVKKPAKTAAKKPTKKPVKKNATPKAVKERAEKPLDRKAILKKFNPISFKDEVALFLKGKRIKTSSFDRYADPNYRKDNKSINLNWLSKTGDALDRLAVAFEMENQYGRDEKEIIDTMVDIILDHPGGVYSYMRQQIEEMEENPLFQLNGDDKPALKIRALPYKLAKKLGMANGIVSVFDDKDENGIDHIYNSVEKGFKSKTEVIDFIKEVLNDYNEIRKSYGNRYVFVKRINNRIAVVAIRKNKKGLILITAYEARLEQIKKMPIIWTRPAMLGSLSSSLETPTLRTAPIQEEENCAGFGSSKSGNTNIQNSCQNKAIKSASELANANYETLKLPTVWANWLGAPAPNFDMVVYGPPGSRKTTLLLILAEDLASIGRVAFASSEEYGSPTLVKKIRDNEIERVEFAGHYRDFDLNQYQFLFIDSVNDMKMTLDEYKALRNQYPNLGVIFILQSTKQGSFRGGQDWIHEPEIQVKVENGQTQTMKNRWAMDVKEVNLN